MIDPSVWRFSDSTERKNKSSKLFGEMMTLNDFLNQCDIPNHPFDSKINALGQVSLNDSTCMIFDE
jgi:hypothetical protein